MLRRQRSSDTPSAAPDQLPDSICALPWLNLSIDVDGSTRPCCKFAHQDPGSPYQMANLRDHTLEAAWHGEGLQRLRRDFRAGIRPAECSTCWDEEAAGVASYRQTFADYRQLPHPEDFDDATPPPPSALDLKLTNACNLKCRICGPVASSLWLQEELSIGEPRPGSFVAQLRDERTYYLSNKLTQSAPDQGTLRRWIHGLRYLELTGGEPMLSPENRELIDLIVTEGSPERVGILFNTNATVIDDRILRHLDRFGEVKICLSIDDVGPRFEYQRFPAEWATVEANLARYQEVARQGWHLYAFCSVSTFNVWYLPEYLAWLRDREDPTPLELTLNYVHYPRHFSVQVLPEPVKLAVTERLERDVLDDATIPPGHRDAVRDLISFMGGSRPDDAASWRTGVDTVEERDRIRDQAVRSVFPEYFEVLDRHGVWDDPATADS